MRKLIILLFALLLMASCTAGPYGYIYDETKEAEYLDYLADRIAEREATEEARDSYIYYGEERYRDENGLAHDIGSNYSSIPMETNNVSTNNGSGKIIYNSDGSYIDENGLAHRGNSVSTWTVDNYNTKELKRTGNYLYVPYPDEDPYKDSPEYQVEYQNYLDEHDGID